MRLIDADELKELFSEVIGRIAIKPEMNGNLEHMIRASAMVIQMIDDAPTVQLGTNLAEVGTNLVSKPTGGCIKCAKCTHVRTSSFCGNKKLTNKQLYNEKGYCSEFVPKCGAKMEGGEQDDTD